MSNQNNKNDIDIKVHDMTASQSSDAFDEGLSYTGKGIAAIKEVLSSPDAKVATSYIGKKITTIQLLTAALKGSDEFVTVR